MYQVYYYDMMDNAGNEFKVKIRGPLLADDNARQSQMNRFRNRLHQCSTARTVRESYGWERVRNVPNISSNSSNQMIVKMGYDTPSGHENSFILPSPDLDVIDMLSGDLVDLSSNPIANLVNRLQDESSEIDTGETITFQYAVFNGTGE